MKKISFKKVLASVAALSVVGCMAAIPASAADGTWTVTIDQKELDVKDIADASKNPVALYVNTEASEKGFTDYEFGLKVDERCTFEFINDSDDAEEKGGKSLSRSVTMKPGSGNFMWIADARDTSMTKAMRIALVMVTVPSDAKPGDKFEVNFTKINGSGKDAAFAKDQNQGLSYDLANVDGYVLITGEEESSEESSEPESSEPESSEESSEESSAPESSEESSEESSAAESSSEASSETSSETSSAASSETSSTTSSAASSGTSSTGSSSGSPKTGSSDVLPIAGAAAAVAVLGGVALVAKKKND